MRTGSCQKSKIRWNFLPPPVKPATLAFYIGCGGQCANAERRNARAYHVSADGAMDCVGRWEIRSCWSPREGWRIPRVTARKRSDSKALRGKVPLLECQHFDYPSESVAGATLRERRSERETCGRLMTRRKRPTARRPVAQILD